MKKRQKETSHRTALFCIWTILNQDMLIAHFKIYVFLGTLVVLFLHLAGKIGTTVALGGLFVGGLSIMILMAMLIQARKKSLLAIRDPELREIAHEAMMVYIHRKKLTPREKKFLIKRLEKHACTLGHC
ncbi:hypothetical protein [Desulfococcus multivorans]|jgi:hypothetical protein|uniref:Uncharacterized protein n=1 Tax=Desulfococcus multivorans DSM 2059 TaxID=1121405 RepID=S7TKJ8_DESML|nr:hypothetical protein [Desulfococcus multivorans]AOY58733.1 uncharacterized protein Dmul_19600 [Desulfococcus multivorans]AQV01016.1 hypothetical protein B2D07_09720 [Desulfococcus multivorans]EPR37717.1 hypothetical protein dsmv_3006 [Desulfococcus multivorans DSM 2059]SJZ47273.1 hypothetical protein SAMN02745446_00654 [Desulfococcus multivorans DSM 2059]